MNVIYKPTGYTSVRHAGTEGQVPAASQQQQICRFLLDGTVLRFRRRLDTHARY